MYIALVCRYLAGRYAGNGGRGDRGGMEDIGVWVRIEESEGRGARNVVADDFAGV